MSTIPYIAPWQTEFHRYSTQQVVFPGVGVASQTTLTVPSAQWWRVVMLFMSSNIAVGAQARTFEMFIRDAASFVVYDLRLSATWTNGSTGSAVALPSAQLTAATSGNGAMFGMFPLPEVLWPAGTSFELDIALGGAGDHFEEASGYVEVYTEDRTTGALVPAPEPLLLT